MYNLCRYQEMKNQTCSWLPGEVSRLQKPNLAKPLLVGRRSLKASQTKPAAQSSVQLTNFTFICVSFCLFEQNLHLLKASTQQLILHPPPFTFLINCVSHTSSRMIVLGKKVEEVWKIPSCLPRTISVFGEPAYHWTHLALGQADYLNNNIWIKCMENQSLMWFFKVKWLLLQYKQYL